MRISDWSSDVCSSDLVGAGGIASVATRQNGAIKGDLFIDCTGHASLLIGGHLGVEWVDRGDTLFNDRALAAQVPVVPGSPIASQTVSTAHEAGWIWDIGLPDRRGIGCVYASRFMEDEPAEAVLRAYIARVLPGAPEVPARRLSFPTGHREIGRAHVCTPVNNAHLVCRPLLEKKNKKNSKKLKKNKT